MEQSEILVRLHVTFTRSLVTGLGFGLGLALAASLPSLAFLLILVAALAAD